MPEAASSVVSPARSRGAFPGSTTILAFDFGERRTGVAVGDRALGTAHPLKAFSTRSDAERLDAVEALVREWHPSTIVVGVPHRDAEAGAPGAPAGARSSIANRAQRFGRRIEGRFGVPVAHVDERYSSAEAESRIREAAGNRRAARASREREIDSYAAQLLLEQYLSESVPGTAS